MLQILRLPLVFVLGFLPSCVNGQMPPRQVLSELPVDLPREMRERFDIKDADSIGVTSRSNENKNLSIAEISIKPVQQKKDSDLKGRLKIEKSADQSASAEMKSDLPSRSLSSGAAYPQRHSNSDPIWVGERLIYTISYLGIPAGEVHLEVLPFKKMNSRKVFHFFGHATSAPLFGLFYRLNDTIESFVDYEGIFSHRLHLALDEKKQQRDSIELFDSEKKQTFYWSRWEYPDHSKKEVKETAAIAPFVQDSLSSLYYLRTIPLEPNAVVSFPMVSEGKSSEVVCTVVRRESYRSPLGVGTAIVVRPEVKYGGVLKKTGDSFIWYTDDDRRFPVRMEARVRLGTIVAELKEIVIGSTPNRGNASVQR
jgi:hypothetical protein